MNFINNIEEMINSSDIECKYLAVSMLKYGEVKMSKTKKNKLIKKVNIIDRIKNLDDVYSELNIKEEDVLIFKNPKNKFERYINACAIIPKITEVFNEGWIPDFNNSNEYKYFPYFIINNTPIFGLLVSSSYYVVDYACMGSGFYLKTDNLAKLVGEKFIEIYIDYLPE